MRALTREWVNKAEHDFEAILLTFVSAETPLADVACFHAQQCAEKYLKAYLTQHQVDFKRQHLLGPLLAKCVEIAAEFSTLDREVDSLEGYAVAIRYPGATVTRAMERRPMRQHVACVLS